MDSSKQRVPRLHRLFERGINLQSLHIGNSTTICHGIRTARNSGKVASTFRSEGSGCQSYLLYGSDNPIDGIVLDVILRKVREIKRATGINVPFPEDSKSIIDTIAQALLVNSDRRISTSKIDKQLKFDFDEFDEAKSAKLEASDKMDRMAEQEKTSRSIFAQMQSKRTRSKRTSKKLMKPWRPDAVREFVYTTVNNLLGAQIVESGEGFKLFTNNLPPALRSTITSEDQLLVSFNSPTPEATSYIGRNIRSSNNYVCWFLPTPSVGAEKHAARSAVIRTDAVGIKTKPFCCSASAMSLKLASRIINRGRGDDGLGYRGTGSDGDFLTSN